MEVSDPIGFVGLGRMGLPIARRLGNRGFNVIAASASGREHAPATFTGGWRASPSDVATECRLVLLMVRDPGGTEAVVDGPHGLWPSMPHGSVVVDLSTNDPLVTRRLGARLAERNVAFIAAPVTGTPEMARRGRLTTLVGGDKVVAESLQTLWRAFARSWMFIGSAEAAATLKLAINIGVSIQVAAYVESILLAQMSGVRRETAVAAYLDSALASPMLRQRGRYLLDEKFTPAADLALIKKDLRLALEAAGRVGATLPVTSLVATLVDSAARISGDGSDPIALWSALEAMSVATGTLK